MAEASRFITLTRNSVDQQVSQFVQQRNRPLHDPSRTTTHEKFFWSPRPLALHTTEHLHVKVSTRQQASSSQYSCQVLDAYRVDVQGEHQVSCTPFRTF